MHRDPARFFKYTFSEQFHSVVKQAVRESDALRHDYVGTGHMMLALLREDRGPAAEILAALNVNREEAAVRLLANQRPGNQTQPMGERPYTTRAVRAIEHAMESADQFRELTIDVDHLLIGLMSVDEGIAAQVLSREGVTAEAVTEEAKRLRQ